MNPKARACCARCGRSEGQVKLYRDPFGEAIAPGRWPTLRMHPDCFLAHIRAHRIAPSGGWSFSAHMRAISD